MTTPAHIQAYVESLTGHQLNRDEGVQHGDAKRDMTVVTVAWMASPEAIRAARENRSCLMIVHALGVQSSVWIHHISREKWALIGYQL